MLKNFIPFTSKTQRKYTNYRKGETKFGEQINVHNIENTIEATINQLKTKFIVFGVCEAVGVYANYGSIGTQKAYKATLKQLVNVQSNIHTYANQVTVLGCFKYPEADEMILQPQTKKNIKAARGFVNIIDTDVSYLVALIVKAQKIPIIIGGGHNNSYGNIKGSTLALNRRINVINFDAHSDFRAQEGRHSGNGFSYAYAEGFLKHYAIFGLHKMYNSQNVLDTFNTNSHLHCTTFDDLCMSSSTTYIETLTETLLLVAQKPYGIELDCDAIANISSSAQTLSGFTVNQARQFVTQAAAHPNATYLHICEAAPKKHNAKQIGKFISYLIIDFINANATI